MQSPEGGMEEGGGGGGDGKKRWHRGKNEKEQNRSILTHTIDKV